MNSQEASLSSFPLDSSSELSIAWRRQREWVWWGWWRRASAAIETRNITQRLHCLNVYCVLERALLASQAKFTLECAARWQIENSINERKKKSGTTSPQSTTNVVMAEASLARTIYETISFNSSWTFFSLRQRREKNSQLQKLKVYKWDEMEAFPSIPNKIHISFPSLNRSLHDCETTAMIDAEEDGEKLWKWKIWCFH